VQSGEQSKYSNEKLWYMFSVQLLALQAVE